MSPIDFHFGTDADRGNSTDETGVDEAGAIQVLGTLLPTMLAGFAVFVVYLVLRSRWTVIYDPKQEERNSKCAGDNVQ